MAATAQLSDQQTYFLCFVLSVIFEWFTMRWNARLFFNRFCRPLLQEVVAVFHLVSLSLTEVLRAALWLARLPQNCCVVMWEGAYYTPHAS